MINTDTISVECAIREIIEIANVRKDKTFIYMRKFLFYYKFISIEIYGKIIIIKFVSIKQQYNLWLLGLRKYMFF